MLRLWRKSTYSQEIHAEIFIDYRLSLTVSTSYFQMIQQNVTIPFTDLGIIETPKVFSFCGFDRLSLAVCQCPPDVLLEHLDLLE